MPNFHAIHEFLLFRQIWCSCVDVSGFKDGEKYGLGQEWKICHHCIHKHMSGFVRDIAQWQRKKFQL